MYSSKPILVTGSHRSGTTWVGRMLAASPGVAYIGEPFRIDHDIGTCNARFDRWFTYICERNGHEYYEPIKDTIGFRYNLFGKLRLSGHPRSALRELRRYLRWLECRVLNIRPLIRDPIAVFSAEWLSAKFNTDTIVMIRHPAAFAGSLKVKHWTHPFSHFLEQPLLMEDHLFPFEDEIRYFAEKDRDIVDQAALLWKLIHYMILKFRRAHPEWIFVRHEDLSRSPQDGFNSLFGRIGLEFTEHVAEVVSRHSSADDSAPPKSRDYWGNIQKDSASNIWNWKSRLAPAEIRRVRAQVEDVSREFYSDEDWRMDEPGSGTAPSSRRQFSPAPLFPPSARLRG